MKKLVIFIGTLVSAFLFTLFLLNVHAEEGDPTVDTDPTTTETTGEEESNNDEESTSDTNDSIDKLLNIELTDEQLATINDFIKNTTNEEIANMTMALYVEIGVAAIFSVLATIALVYFLMAKIKNNAETQAVVDGVAKLIAKSKADDEESQKAFTAQIKNLMLQVIASNNDASSKQAKEKASSTDAKLDSLIEQIDNM